MPRRKLSVVLFAAWAVVVLGPLSALADLGSPVEGGVVTSGVGLRLDPFGSGKMAYHRGIDIAVPVGTAVRATRAGRVLRSGVQGGYGNTVVILHDNGDRTVYGHNSGIVAKAGDRVEAGTVIAYSGNSGRSTGPHVHYEIQPARGTAVAMANVQEAKAPSPRADHSVRQQQEQKVDEAMDSVLHSIRTSSLIPRFSGPGG